MNRGILIALVVAPLVASAGPRKKPAPKKKTAVEEPAQPVPAQPDPAPTAAPAATQATGTSPSTASGAPGPATTVPAAQPQPQPVSPEPAAAEVDVDSLRQEYMALRDELFKSRARANAVASQLYSTRMTIKFTWGSARFYGVSKASIRLDGATVFEDATGAIASDDGVRFDGYVAPGRHLVTFHVEAIGKDDDSFISSTETQITVQAVPNKDLVVTAKGRDSGDIAFQWKKRESGSYGLGIDVAVKSVAQGTAAGKGKK
jgi:hypothetical protein